MCYTAQLVLRESRTGKGARVCDLRMYNVPASLFLRTKVLPVEVAMPESCSMAVLGLSLYKITALTAQQIMKNSIVA